MHKSSQWTNEWDQLNVPDQLNVWDRPNVLPLGENAWTPVHCMREIECMDPSRMYERG